MKERITKAQAAMRKLGSFGGKATVKKYGKSHMKKLSKNYWKNADRSKLKAE